MENILIPKYIDAIGNGLAVLQKTLSVRDEFDFDPEENPKVIILFYGIFKKRKQKKLITYN